MSIFKLNYVQSVTNKNRYGEEVTTQVVDKEKIVKHAIAAVAAIIFVAWAQPFTSVPTGHRGVVTQFGKIVGIEQEGLVVLPPWQKLSIFNVRAESADVDKANAATKDLQPVNASLTVRYQVIPDRIAHVYENYAKDGVLDSYVASAVQEVLKAVTAKYSATELIEQRALVSSEIQSGLNAKLSQFGATVLNIDIRNFTYSESYMAAINEKSTQEQAAAAAVKKNLTVAAEQEQKVTIAEAEARAIKASADGEAYAKLAAAKAEAEALRLVNAAVRESKDVLELERIKVSRIEAERWDGVRVANQFYGSAPVPVHQVAAPK